MGTGHKLTLYLNKGGVPIQWTSHVIDDISGGHHIYSFDFDFDDDNDILVSEPETGEIFWWKNNNGNPIIWERETIADFESVVRTLPGDFDNDGDYDILGAGKFSNELSIWYNQGGNPFGWSKEIIVDQLNYFWPIYIADMDGDTDLDFVAGAGGPGIISWWENDKITSNSLSSDNSFDLLYCYPNPFISVMIIQYKVATRSKVVLDILDNSGNPISSIVDEDVCPGKYSFEFEGSDLNLEYFYIRFRVNDQMVGKQKVIRVK